MLKGLISHFRKEKATVKKTNHPIIFQRAEHSISRNAINPNALKVLHRLSQGGFSAYLVGGCVRDLLLGHKPKDFDIATNARPEEVRKLFKNCRLIGKRFRLAHILFGRDIIEVATFRTHHENAEENQGKMLKGQIVRDNVYGAIEDDVWRRDFRMNALYYNFADSSVVDYTGGMADIKNKVLHMIGDPEQRFHEDPVRLLRTARFLAKLDVTISPETEEPLTRLSYLLQHVSPARLFQEVLKIFHGGANFATINLLQKYHLFVQLFPQTDACYQKPGTKTFLEAALINTDQRINEGKTVSPAFLLAVLLWPPTIKQAKHFTAEKLPMHLAIEKASQLTLKQQSKTLAMPRVLQNTVREIFSLQSRLNYRRGKVPYRTLEHPRFRAAYDMLLLRKQAGEHLEELVTWWTDFQHASAEKRAEMLKESNKTTSSKKRRPKKTNQVKHHGENKETGPSNVS